MEAASKDGKEEKVPRGNDGCTKELKGEMNRTHSWVREQGCQDCERCPQRKDCVRQTPLAGNGRVVTTPQAQH